MLLNEYGQSFDQMGKILWQDEKSRYTIYAGNIFEAKTVKGNTNLLVAMRVMNGWMYYTHGDKVRKVRLEQFTRAVMSGDIIPRSANEVDTERLTMAVIALDSIANRRTAEETMNYYGEQAEEQLKAYNG